MAGHTHAANALARAPLSLASERGHTHAAVCAETHAAVCAEQARPLTVVRSSPRRRDLRAAGIVVIHKSATIKHALKAQADGVDFIEIAGMESSIAGRSSDDDITIWVLATLAVSKLTTPVIVSGSSATGRQLAAAIALGAQGITMGTRFLATKESPVHSNVKAHLAKPETDEFSTTIVLRSFNNATRVLKNDVTREILRLEAEMAKQGGGDFKLIAPLASGQRSKAMFHETGDWNDAMWSCGMSVGLIDDVPTCAALVARVEAEAEAQLLKGGSAVVRHSRI
jgi:NAD(P)H-dependent flavin oxidoreductase YrpB (nitropropane dioxygenase family)